MGKIINIACRIFILGLMVWTTYFAYAQDIDTSDYWIIRIKDPDNPWKWITIHDRNLWASATWYWATDDINTYWYYFQWWNNYWFSSDPNVVISANDYQVDTNQYWPNTENWYYKNSTFIKRNNDRSKTRNDDLRWWEWDDKYNHRWYPLTITSTLNRRWPCPENYHIPSIWEWSKLIELRAWKYSITSIETDDNWLYKFTNNTHHFNTFNQFFYLPIAGQRDITSKIINDLEFFWSSSPNDSFYSLDLYGNYDNISTQDFKSRVNAFPIRCFYNSYRLPVKITYKVNWWYNVLKSVWFKF